MQMLLNRKRKTKDPCPKCFMHRERCICEFIPSLQLKTKVSLIVHAKELKRTTNTGRLALLALTNSEMQVRGQGKTPTDLTSLLRPDYRTLLFYPSDEASDLTPEFVLQSSLPIQLIVPDGNWRQASKVHYRHPELAGVPRVMISTPNLALDHLRAENTEHGMSTIQAIAMALGIIEGKEVGDTLMNLYLKKLEQTLIGRGHKISTH
jgi:DTW domain-containing protein YfiP